MIQRNRSACKHLKIFTHNTGSKGAPRRGTDKLERMVINNEREVEINLDE
jgi:hypothetical protein